jgi:hypothetical protein
MLEQRYSSIDRTQDFMINHNESDLRRLGMESGWPDSQPTALSGLPDSFEDNTDKNKALNMSVERNKYAIIVLGN